MSAAPAAPGIGGVLGFSVQGQSMALPVADVLEIVRVPACTRVPNAPASLVGVANLRGSVLPVVSVARLLGVADSGAPAGPLSRVVVVAGPVGLLVDAVSALSRTAARLLDPVALLTRAFGGLLRPTGVRHDRTAHAAEAADAMAREALALIALRVAGQEYAFPLGRVAEVLRLPATLAEVPRSDDAMLGVVAFRGGLLPVASLSALLGLRRTATDGAARIMVTELDGVPVGLLVDQVSGTLAVPVDAIDPVPPVLLRGRGEARLAGICRLAGGRLVAVLSPDRLFDATAAARIRSHREQEAASMPGAEASPSHDAGDAIEQFVAFRVGDEQYGLPIAFVDEVVRCRDALTRMPHAPDFVLGIMYLRGRAIPVIDASRRFAVAGDGSGDGGRVVVVTVDGVQAGLAVDAVSEVLSVRSSALRAAPELEGGRPPLFDRVAIGRHGRMILLISARRLLEQAERDVLASLANAGARSP